MKDPAFLFYPESFLGGVTDLTMEERGQFITLLCLQHVKGRLSEKTIRLSVGLVSDDVRLKFNIDENGLLYNERLEVEMNKREKFTNSRRENGKKGGRPTYKIEEITDRLSVGYPKNNLPINININRNINKNIDNNVPKNSKKFVAPTLIEVEDFFTEKSFSKEQAHKAFEYYSIANWKDSRGNQVKNWKQKMISVWMNDNNNQNGKTNNYKADTAHELNEVFARRYGN